MDNYVGFADLPNQLHRQSLVTGFDVSIMLAGESGLGKSTFANTLFAADIYQSEKLRQPGDRISSTVGVQRSVITLEEDGVEIRLTIVDTPGFGQQINNDKCWVPLSNYIDKMYEKFLDDESRVNRSKVIDTRVHACLYFIEPTGHGLKALDIAVMKELATKTNLIPIIGKADLLTDSEEKAFKAKILLELSEAGIHIFQFPTIENDGKTVVPESIFAVIGSSEFVKTNEGNVRARTYPWGVATVENVGISDFVSLRNLMIRSHLWSLIDSTNKIHYENFRNDKLSDSVTTGSGDDFEVSNMEELKAAHNRKLQQMEKDLNRVVEEKVQDKEKKIQEQEQRLLQKHEEMQQDLKNKRKQLTADKEKFIQQKKIDEQRAIEIAAQERAAAEHAAQQPATTATPPSPPTKTKKKGIFG